MQRWQVKIGPLTHLLMDGGILLVDKPDEFHQEYIKELKIGKRLYVVEAKSEHFKFFVDMDYQGEEELDGYRIIEFATRMTRIVGTRCFIAKSPARPLPSGKIKTGVHFHWPDKLVTKQDAIKLKNQIIIEWPDMVDWVDSSVYAGSGLRMVWSHKREKNADYPPYTPWKTLSIKGDLTDIPPEPSLDTLKYFVIRTDEVPQSKTSVDKNWDGLEGFINRNIPGQEQATVIRVFKTRSDTTLCVQTNSRFCENVGKCHQRNHIWFAIKRGTIYQMCLDEDCREFKGRAFKLPPSIVVDLQDGDVAEIDASGVSFRDVFALPKTSPVTDRLVR